MKFLLTADDAGSFGLVVVKNAKSAHQVHLFEGTNGFAQCIAYMGHLPIKEIADIGVIFWSTRFSVARRLSLLANLFHLLSPSAHIWSTHLDATSIKEVTQQAKHLWENKPKTKAEAIIAPHYITFPNITKRKKQIHYVEHVSAGGYIWHKGKILLVKNFYHGGIIPPHGHVERGETKLQAAMREICEETGYCDIQPEVFLGHATYTFFEKGKMNRKKEYRWLFTLRSTRQQPKQTEESESLQNRWMSIAVALRQATFENTKKDLRRLPALLKKRVVAR